MPDGLIITFEMELARVEEYIPTERLRMMWEFAMNLIKQLQASVDEYREELDSRDCHNVPTTISEAGN